ncbi:spoVK [Symbiodinium sp. CCMP2592]|nr:spoVK [Symbiodinium sp. CCMP2592]
MASSPTASRLQVAVSPAADFGTVGDPELWKRVKQDVERLTGMANVKAFFSELSRTVGLVGRGGDLQGTGKKTVARLIGRYLYAHGVLHRGTFVELHAPAPQDGGRFL